MLKQACFEHPLSAVTMTLPAFAAQCWRLQNTICSTAVAVRQYLLPAWCSAANPPAAVAAVDQCDIQTDGHPTVTYTLLRILCRQHQQLDPENTGHQSNVATSQRRSSYLLVPRHLRRCRQMTMERMDLH